MLDADADEVGSTLTERLRTAVDDAIAMLNTVQNGILTRPPLYLYKRLRSKGASDPFWKLLGLVTTARRTLSYPGLLYSDAVKTAKQIDQQLELLWRSRFYSWLIRLAKAQSVSQSMPALANMEPLLERPCAQDLNEIDPQLLDVTSAIWINVPPLGAITAPEITIIVPVYKGREHTLACLHSVLAARNHVSARLLVIDDCSPDEQLRSDLQRLTSRKLFDLIQHADNRGFASTVNDGILSTSGDIVLLNADTLVCDRWLDHLLAAANALQELGSVSPLSNNATILSYPEINSANPLPTDLSLRELCQLLEEQRGEDTLIEIPTTVGFCMYVPRRVFEEVGIFDETAFGHGYGEECDWAMRARQKGYRHYVTTRAFVYHHGGVSFSDRATRQQTESAEILRRRYPHYWPLVAQHVAADPLAKTRRFLDRHRLTRAARGAPVVLDVFHSVGGGTKTHVQHLSKLLKGRGILSVFAQPDGMGRVKLSSNFLDQIPNLTFAGFWDDQEFLTLLRDLRVKCIHLHHFMGFAPEVLKFIEGADFPLVITLHDFSYICPQVVLLNEHDLFCGVPFAPKCNQCVSAKPPILHTTNVGQWRENMRRLFSRAERISAPSETAAKLYRKIWPDLPIAVIPHPEKPLEDHLAVRAAPGNVRTVAIVGTIGDHKGVTVVEGCVRDAEARKLPLKFAVVGEFQSQLESPYLDVTGRFSPGQLPSILSTLGAGVGFLPSIWPETYSYVLSEYYRNGLHPVVFDIGAQSERVKASGYGTVLPVHTGAPAINDTLLGIKTELVARQPPTGLPDNDYVDVCYGPLLFGNLGRAVGN